MQQYNPEFIWTNKSKQVIAGYGADCVIDVLAQVMGVYSVLELTVAQEPVPSVTQTFTQKERPHSQASTI